MLKNAIVVCGGVALGLAAAKYLKPKKSPHTPIVLVVTVEIAKERLEAFREAMAIDAAGSRAEPGCLRFDLLEDAENRSSSRSTRCARATRGRGVRERGGKRAAVLADPLSV